MAIVLISWIKVGYFLLFTKFLIRLIVLALILKLNTFNFIF
jgi:hypothetical protein